MKVFILRNFSTMLCPNPNPNFYIHECNTAMVVLAVVVSFLLKFQGFYLLSLENYTKLLQNYILYKVGFFKCDLSVFKVMKQLYRQKYRVLDSFQMLSMLCCCV
jgi:hypothetical protein